MNSNITGMFRLCRIECPSCNQDLILSCLVSTIKKISGDFPGGPVVKNPPSNAGDAGSIPGWGTKIPHAAGHLSPRALEPAHHN